MILHTIGYGKWPAKSRMEKMAQRLQQARVGTLIDIRHAACASQLMPTSNYGPRDWHLQADGAGICAALTPFGIEYLWLLELGNPQKQDHDMLVLREHIASGDICWPVNRGLRVLGEHLHAKPDKPAALMCACKDWRQCHRLVIAEAARDRFPDLEMAINHL